MAEVTDPALNGQFDQIRDETAAGANTKLRVYNAFKNLYDTLNGSIGRIVPPPSPTGVSFSTAPGAPTVTNTGITETASVVNNNGTPVNIPSLAMPYTLAAAGKKRRDAIVVDYLNASPTYVRIAGAEVNSSDVAPTPSIPVNRLFVRYLDISDGAATAYQSELASKADAAAVTSALAGKLDKAGAIFTGNLYANPPANNDASVGLNWGDRFLDFYQKNVSNIWTRVFQTGDIAHKFIFRWFDSVTPALTKDTVIIGRDVVDIDADLKVKGVDIKDLSINTQAGSYTLALPDRGNMVRMNVASANTLTVPPNSAVAFPVGTQIVLAQAGAGQTTIVAGSGVTINASGAKMKLTGQYSGATLIQVSANVWTLLGDLSA